MAFLQEPCKFNHKTSLIWTQIYLILVQKSENRLNFLIFRTFLITAGALMREIISSQFSHFCVSLNLLFLHFFPSAVLKICWDKLATKTQNLIQNSNFRFFGFKQCKNLTKIYYIASNLEKLPEFWGGKSFSYQIENFFFSLKKWNFLACLAH